MPESNQTDAPVVELSVEKTSRLKRFTQTHPRTAKLVGFTAGACAIIAITSTVKNLKANKDKLAEAADHAQEGLHALSDAASTPDTAA